MHEHLHFYFTSEQALNVFHFILASGFNYYTFVSIKEGKQGYFCVPYSKATEETLKAKSQTFINSDHAFHSKKIKTSTKNAEPYLRLLVATSSMSSI